MTIRNMTIEDYQAVYSLWLSCAGMGLNNLDDSRDGIDRFLKRNPDTCFVAVEDEIVGVIIAGHDGRRGYIYHTAVSPRCRKQGIASKLVAKVEEAMKEIGINKLVLVVFDKNEAGNGFWQEQGFTVREDLVYRNKAVAEIERIDT
ncbi:MAG: GNAT family N-acetyltransferase [Lachnospiraceae bacterium]|nr:GNAT family N-acetyltransferase [Lachnospiraceae bacterium]